MAPQQSNDTLAARIDALEKRADRYNERIEQLDKTQALNLQWGNAEHLRIQQEIATLATKLRDELRQEYKEMQEGVQQDIKELKELIENKGKDWKQTWIPIICVFLTAILSYVVIHVF